MNMSANDNNRDLSTKCASMAQLSDTLSNQVHRAILDKTGLTGGFDLDLKWAPDDISDANPDSALSIFTAIQEQLGLKLQPSHGPVDTLVIDHAQMPSEN
jgi:bla regulator protein BlaR1